MKSFEEIRHDFCGTPDCCGECDTAVTEAVKQGASNPRIVTLNMGAAKDEIKKAIKYCGVASGKHADKSAKMKCNKAVKLLQQAMKALD